MWCVLSHKGQRNVAILGIVAMFIFACVSVNEQIEMRNDLKQQIECLNKEIARHAEFSKAFGEGQSRYVREINALHDRVRELETQLSVRPAVSRF